jgi:hypothetical protein
VKAAIVLDGSSTGIRVGTADFDAARAGCNGGDRNRMTLSNCLADRAPAGAPMEGIPMTSYDSWSTFMKGQVAGADVNKDKAEWESLIDRQRAALHENFARELPLEYREMLKEYYQALSK